MFISCFRKQQQVLFEQAGFPVPNAPSSECLPNVVPNSKLRTCQDPQFPKALHSDFMNTPNVMSCHIM